MRVKDLGLADYAATQSAMQAFTAQRSEGTPDELWLCEHPAVYTQGLAGLPEHLLSTSRITNPIPVVQSNRGGQITYHGPGQVVAYPLLNLQRRGYFVREYVHKLEEATIKTLAHFGITGHRLRGAPGVYVQLADPHGHSRLPESVAKTPTAANMGGVGKIAALGIKVSRHCTYHGLALNVAMDLVPFTAINPCGFAGLHTLDMASLGVTADLAEVQAVLVEKLQTYLEP